MKGRATLILGSLLVLALVSASTILDAALQRNPVTNTTSAATANVRLVTSGTLLMNKLPVFPSDIEPHYGQYLTILGSSGPITPDTNGSESFAMVLKPGPYLLQVGDPRFHLAIPFQILLGNVTIVTVLVVKHAAFPYFAEVPDADSSGWITKGSILSVGFFLQSILVHENDLAFIEAPSKSGYSGIDSNATGRTVVTSVDSRGEATFVQLRSLQDFRTASLAGSLVVVYDPTYTVRVSSAGQ